MKKLFIIFISGVILRVFSQAMPCCAPPTIANVVKPNILIVWDITGSMRWRATWDGTQRQDPNWDYSWYCGGNYDPNRIYYGYFHPDSIYRYQSNKWVAVGYNPDHSLNITNFNFDQDRYLGNILNWAVMSRNDVAKKALTGGKGEPTNQIDKHTLIGEGDGGSGSYYGWPTISFEVGGRRYRFDKPRYMSQNPDIFYVVRRSPSSTKTYRCNVDVSRVPKIYKIGVIRLIADKDTNGNWDPEAPRFGLMTFTTYQSPYAQVLRELYQSDEDPDMEPYINTINNITPGGGTPVGDAVFEAIHYMRYCSPHWSGAYQWNINQVGTHKDPWFTGFPQNPQSAWCRKSFIILIGDGESNSDRPVSSDGAHLPAGPFSGRSLCNYYTGTEKGMINGDCCSGCDDPADDYAYYAHLTDLRPDNEPRYGLPCPQNLTFYTLFCFGVGAGGEELFQDIAAFGGFDDKNLNLIPDGYPNTSNEEWDKDGNLIPDNYYLAQSGEEIEKALIEIIYRIMAGAASATSASIVSQTSKGEGIASFALYYPRKIIGGRDYTWLGEIKGLWIDRFGLLREETENNLTLHLKNDYVISFAAPDTGVDQCNPQTSAIVYKFKDINCTGDSLELVYQGSIDELNPLWDGGRWLWNASPDERNIFTWLDLNNDNSIQPSEIFSFHPTNKTVIFPYLDVSSIDLAEKIINYVRGIDYPEFRERTINNKVWKLGDIIYSSPLLVQKPMERYDLLYLDEDYKEFYNAYYNRRGVVYAGANDGMVHAFNIGRYVRTDESECEVGYIDPMGIPMGKEMWAYIPFNLLPHLKWLKETNYCHVYYVDLKPYPTDAKIFTPDDIHVGGFGTLLIGSARLGGTPYQLGGNILSSSYFCIDITKPEEPTLLWEKNLPDYSYTVPYPNVVKVGDNWFLVCASGPKDCAGFSNQNAKIYILDLKTGNLLKTFTVPEANSAISDIFSVDLGLDYTVDLIYFGTYYNIGTQNNPNWEGRIYRIKTHQDENPDEWDLSLVMSLNKPITAAGGATLDEYGNLWIYFGTGRLFYDGDEGDLERQVFVGIKDDTVSTYTYTDLFNVTNVKVYEDSVKIGNTRYTWEQFVDMVKAKKGWYRELLNTGERCLYRPLIIGGAVIFTTFSPETGDICGFGGGGKLYALYYLTGTAYKRPILGLTPSGEIAPFVEVGGGMPSEPAMWIGASEEKVFVQIKGQLKDLQTYLPLNPRGGLILWKGR
ncbi:MAG: PilC/PilY family type IV pilus protein [candidate division WOR-3 bacterium]